ncbi:MAG: BTAD domain-containing putative transcriptional regulator [Anaerolineales bacterium]|jgi:DNA-binding SARP family transcriptional activator/predicted ATPase
MAHLSLSLLGPFRVALDGNPVKGLKSNKVRALLAYLSVEADKPHHRETLAGLLWPDRSDRDALSNLRYTLSNLRQVIGDRTARPPFLLITRDRLQFNAASDYQLDVKSFVQIVEAGSFDSTAIEQLEKAAALYQGNFLEGFYVEGSPAFEEWTLLTRERLARQASTVLHALAAIHEQGCAYEQAQSYVWQQLKLEPWDESAHQRLMRLLALSGQRSAALAQYESCRNALAEELGVEPGEETTRLYQQIRDGKLKGLTPPPVAIADTSVKLPQFLEDEPQPVEPPLFVARQRELQQLKGFLEQALKGQGRIVLVTGEAGSGKTSLLGEFTRRAQDEHQDLIVASGNCNAYTGIGDPYLPFREILEWLTGDVEARWAAGAISREHALRLWNKLPVVAQALMDTGPDLVDTFVQRTALLERAKACVSGQAEWLTRLDQFLDRKPATVISAASLYQADLFVQYTRVMQALEGKCPLLLVIDDLQWADGGSINLLFHLGRRLKCSRILILGAYRSEEIAFGRDGERHPLEPVINEFRREYGDIMVNLGQTESQEFVDAILDSEPNRLGSPFRQMLYQQTRAHPLFTVELLRGLQERGDLVQDAQGYWVAGSSLDWETLPARVEAAIQERISRLPEAQQKMLQVASIEGEDFTAEILAKVLETDDREVVKSLSSELVRKHRLVVAQAIERVGSKRVSRYRFRNYLFQKYLYDNLDEAERAYLHEDVGNALEFLYGEQAGDFAVQLARHFQEAQTTEKAIIYLHQAGERAMRLSAYHEGVAHLTRGLALHKLLPASPANARLELDLQLALAITLQGAIGAQADEVKTAYNRARQLCRQTGDVEQLVQVLGGLSILYYVRAEYRKARQLVEEALSLALGTKNPLLVLLCRWYLGFILFGLGEYRSAHEQLEQVIAVYEPPQHHQSLVFLRGSDAGLGALAYDACCLWCLGYPEQALKLSQKALTLARELGHPFSLADVLCFAGCLFNSMRGDGKRLKKYADELVQLVHDRNLAGWLATGIRSQGEALAMLGQIREGIAKIQEGIAAMQADEVWLYYAGTLVALAEAQAKAGRPEDGLANLEQAFTLIDKTGERHWEPELHRLKGELLLAQGNDLGAETSLRKALEIAREQSAKSLELRAVMSLCRLLKRKAQADSAYRELSKIYNWFTEGFDTPDLIAARQLLEEMSS